MIYMQKDIESKNLSYKMLLQVHDELVLEVPENLIGEAAVWAKERMESAMKLEVPLVVDTGSGVNWLEAH